MDTKRQQIEDFLSKLGSVKKNDVALDGFYIVCKKCLSQNVVTYDDLCLGSEYTGAWGDIGFKCVDCGNAAEIKSY